MRALWLLPAAALMASGCVTAQRFQKSQAEADSWKAKATVLEAELASRVAELEAARKDLETARKALEAVRADKAAAAEAASRVEGDVRTKLAASEERLKAADEQLASLKGSVRDLQQSLEASKGELAKKVSALVAEKDQAAQRLAEAQGAAATLRAAKDAQLADLIAKLTSALQEKSELATRLSQAEAAKAEAERAKAEELEKAKKGYEDLAAGLKAEISAGEIKLTRLQGKLTVQLVDRILFDSGSAEVKPAGRKVLARIGKLLNAMAGKDVRIEGHTDDVPISADLRDRYESNWELSTARATAVARYLQDGAKLDPARLVAAGFGEYRPVAPNDKAEGRALNRRIEIVLVPRD